MKLKLKGRLAFPSLFTPSAFAGSDVKTFQAAILFPSDSPQVKLLNDACDTVGKEKWGEKAAAILKALRAADKIAIHDGDTKEQYDGYAGNHFVNASSKVRPTVRDVDGLTPLVEADGKPYGGCYVVAHIELWAQDNAFGKRINATLRGIQFFKDGDAFAGSSPAGDDEFESLETAEDEEGSLI